MDDEGPDDGTPDGDRGDGDTRDGDTRDGDTKPALFAPPQPVATEPSSFDPPPPTVPLTLPPPSAGPAPASAMPSSFGRSSLDAQRLGNQPLDAQRAGVPQREAQRSQPDSADVQRAEPPTGADVQRAEPPAPRAPDPQRSTAMDTARSVHRLRPRVMIGLAAAIAAATAAVLIVNAQRDDPTTQAIPTLVPIISDTEPATTVVVESSPPVSETVTPTDDTSSPTVATAAPSTAPGGTEPPATTLPPPTGLAGDYDVAVANLTVIADGQTPITVPPELGLRWTLAGPCDGVGECTLSFTPIGGDDSGGTIALVDTVVLAPSGPNTYSGSFDLDLEGCAAGTGTFILQHAPGVFVGTYLAVVPTGGESCLGFSVSGDISGIRTG